jgi:dynein heavy chain
MLPEDWGGGGYNGRLTIFQRLLVLRTLRPDKLVPSIVTYVIDVMGKQYVEPQEFNLSLVYADSMASVPLVFVLSPGSDPMADLLLFADSKVIP